MVHRLFGVWVWVWVWWEWVWVCTSHHVLRARMSTIFVPLPFYWYARPKTLYENFWNDKHPHVFAVHHTRTISERNHIVHVSFQGKRTDDTSPFLCIGIK